MDKERTTTIELTEGDLKEFFDDNPDAALYAKLEAALDKFKEMKREENPLQTPWKAHPYHDCGEGKCTKDCPSGWEVRDASGEGDLFTEDQAELMAAAPQLVDLLDKFVCITGCGDGGKCDKAYTILKKLGRRQ